MLGAGIMLIALTAFNLGKIYAYQMVKTPITITDTAAVDIVRPAGERTLAEDAVQKSRAEGAPVFASRAAKSKLYHFSWCPGAAKISNKNKLTFTTETAAIAAGYTLAGNCKK